MSSESSAITQIVKDANEAIKSWDQPMPKFPLPQDDSKARSLRQEVNHITNSTSGVWIALLAILVVGGAIAGGYLMARQGGGDTATFKPEVMNRDEEKRGQKQELLARVEEKSEPAMEEGAIEPDLELEESLGLELAKNTGVEIRIGPEEARASEITLDGNPIGPAPLRASNLAAGTHSVYIEGPQGYFGRHVEFELKPGESHSIKITLKKMAPAHLESTDQAVNSDAGVVTEPLESAREEHQSKKLTTQERKRNERRQRRHERRRANKKNSNIEDSSNKEAEEMIDEEEVRSVALGTVMLGAKPPCQIFIDGKDTGLVTPQRGIQLTEGVHRVILVNKGQNIRKQFRVRVKAGRTTRAIQDFTVTD